jgi:serine/threonine-protein kinase
MVKGKLGYMAPEQIRLDPVDRRADLFSAGVVLWEALTGTGLFVADTLGASVDLILHGEIPAPSRLNGAVTAELDAVVSRALTRDRDARFQDAMSMATALQRATPLAGALEVIDWVEKLAGPELERKAVLVRRAEALNGDPVDAVRPTLAAVSAEPLASCARTDWSEAVAVSSRHMRRSPTLQGLAKPPEGHRAGSGLVATGETGVAIGGDREASTTTKEKSSRGWKWMGLALGLVLCGSTLGLGVFSLSGGARPSAVARQPSNVEPPGVGVAVSAPALEAPSPAVPNPPASALPSLPRVPLQSQSAASTSLQSEQPPAARRGSVTPSLPRARAARAAPNVRSSRWARVSASSAARPMGVAKASSSIGRSEPARSANRGPTGKNDSGARRSDACKPPWVIDEQNVKTFKAECLR